MNGIKFQFFNAGHVLGAAMILVEVAGVRVLCVAPGRAIGDCIVGVRVLCVAPGRAMGDCIVALAPVRLRWL